MRWDAGGSRRGSAVRRLAGRDQASRRLLRGRARRRRLVDSRQRKSGSHPRPAHDPARPRERGGHSLIAAIVAIVAAVAIVTLRILKSRARPKRRKRTHILLG